MSGMRSKVLLVGLGNIGFRHLQGMTSMAERIQLSIVDPSEAAREQAAAEWQRMGGELGGKMADLKSIPGSFATAILATPARGRLELLRAILPRLTGPDLVLEKVAFGAMEDMHAAGEALHAAEVKGWVNCARRLWPLYARVKECVAGQPIELEIRGRVIGLGSNGVHFLDLLQFLSGETELLADGFEPHDVMESKRRGYFESRGVLTARTPKGSRISISVTESDPAGTEVTLRFGSTVWQIDEIAGAVCGHGGWQGDRAPYQSELTGQVVADLLRGQCALTSFAESVSAHRILLEALGPQMAAAGIDISAGVPIT